MSSQELFGDPNTYSQGIWKTREKQLHMIKYCIIFYVFFVLSFLEKANTALKYKI